MGRPLPEPSATEIVPAEVVEQTIALCTAEIEMLEHRLEVALASARRSIEKLNATSAGRVIDDDFEAAVLEVVDQYTRTIASGLPAPALERLLDNAGTAPVLDAPERELNRASDVAAPVVEAIAPVAVHAPIEAAPAQPEPVIESVSPLEPVMESVSRTEPEATLTVADVVSTGRRRHRRRGTTVVTRPGSALAAEASAAGVAVDEHDQHDHHEVASAVVPVDVAVAESVVAGPVVAEVAPALAAADLTEVVPAVQVAHHVEVDEAAEGAVAVDGANHVGLLDDDADDERGWPAHLMIHAGLILVVFALILFRLS